MSNANETASHRLFPLRRRRRLTYHTPHIHIHIQPFFHSGRFWSPRGMRRWQLVRWGFVPTYRSGSTQVSTPHSFWKSSLEQIAQQPAGGAHVQFSHRPNGIFPAPSMNGSKGSRGVSSEFAAPIVPPPTTTAFRGSLNGFGLQGWLISVLVVPAESQSFAPV